MKRLNQPARRGSHGRVREARTRRSFDAVLASYIRELSAASARPPGESATWEDALRGPRDDD
jgi:hypothetical protein